MALGKALSFQLLSNPLQRPLVAAGSGHGHAAGSLPKDVSPGCFLLLASLSVGRRTWHGSLLSPTLQVLNLTRQCIQRHRDFVVPLLLKYSQEWLRLGNPIFRAPWWLSPTDPTAFTVEDEFLIGDEVGNVGTRRPQRVAEGK